MGGVVSDAKNNADLVENLVDSGYLSDVQIREALNIVDRGRFLCDFERNAFQNRSWRTDDYYLDPSFVFLDALNCLNIKKGDHILNIQSGVGYFGIIASLLTGYHGKFIGIDYSLKNVHYASTRHENFFKRSTAFDMEEFCEPIYIHGDILRFKPGFALFDKVFCSATITYDLLPFLFTFLKINGKMMVTIDESFILCRRINERRFFLKKQTFIKQPALKITEGTILDLYPKSISSEDLFKNSEDGCTIYLDFNLDIVPNMFPNSTEQKMWIKFKNKLELKPQSLKLLCRGKIRNQIRLKYEKDNPKSKEEYFKKNSLINYSYELQRIEILHFSLTNDCCIRRDNYSQNNVTSKLNCKFKDYHRASIKNDLYMEHIQNPKKELCYKCKILDQLTKIELMDHEYLKSDSSHYRYSLEKIIKNLPIPIYLKKFINYNRSFDFNHENFYSENI